MSIWKKHLTLQQLNDFCQHCAVAHLGIEFTAQGDDWLEARMPVDHRTTQPMGFLHGGISSALAETVASTAGLEANQSVVVLEINAIHLRPVKQVYVCAKSSPIRLGKNVQVWQIDIRDAQDKLCCVSRLTLSIITHD